MENIVGFVRYTVSAATTHLGCCSTKTGKDNMSENGGFCVPIKRGGGCSHPPGCNLLTLFRAWKVIDVIEEIIS